MVCSPKEYDYLLKMPLWSLTNEMVEKLTLELSKKKEEYNELNNLSVN